MPLRKSSELWGQEPLSRCTLNPCRTTMLETWTPTENQLSSIAASSAPTVKRRTIHIYLCTEATNISRWTIRGLFFQLQHCSNARQNVLQKLRGAYRNLNVQTREVKNKNNTPVLRNFSHTVSFFSIYAHIHLRIKAICICGVERLEVNRKSLWIAPGSKSECRGARIHQRHKQTSP